MPVQRHQPTQCPVLCGQGRGHQVLQTFLSTFHTFELVVRPCSGCIPICRTKDAPPCLTAWRTTLTHQEQCGATSLFPSPSLGRRARKAGALKEHPARLPGPTPLLSGQRLFLLSAKSLSFLTCFPNNDILVLGTPKGGRLGGEILRHTLKVAQG